MLNVETSLVTTYTHSVALAIDAFLPLIGATVGLFLAFAVANMVRHFIVKATKK